MTPLTKYFTYQSMLCHDMRLAGSHPVVYLAAEAEAVLKEVGEAFAAALREAEAGVYEKTERFFDALEDPDNPLTAAQLIFHFQEHCRTQAAARRGGSKLHLDKTTGTIYRGEKDTGIKPEDADVI